MKQLQLGSEFGNIVCEKRDVQVFLVGGKEFASYELAWEALARESFQVLRDFAFWVAATHGDIPPEHTDRVLPILRAVRESGLDFAQMTAQLAQAKGEK